MNNNLYGGRTYPDAPLMFDKIYPNYKAAIGDIQQGAVFIGRYIIIMYCDTTLSNDLCSALETIEYNEDTLESDVIAVLGDSPPVWKISSAKNYVKNYNVDISGVDNDNRRSYDRIVYKVGADGNRYELIEVTNLHNMSVFADVPYQMEGSTYDIDDAEVYRTKGETVPSVAFVQNVADGTLRAVGSMIEDVLGTNVQDNIPPEIEAVLPFNFYTVNKDQWEQNDEFILNLKKPEQLQKLKIYYDLHLADPNYNLILTITNRSGNEYQVNLQQKCSTDMNYGEVEINNLIFSTWVKYKHADSEQKILCWDEWQQQAMGKVFPITELAIEAMDSFNIPTKVYGRVRVEEYYN